MKSILYFLSLYLHFTLKSREALYSGILCIFSNKFKLFDDGNVSKQFHLSIGRKMFAGYGKSKNISLVSLVLGIFVLLYLPVN